MYRDMEKEPVKKNPIRRVFDWVSGNYITLLVTYIPVLLIDGFGILLARSFDNMEIRVVVAILTIASCYGWVKIIKKVYK